MVWFTDVDDFIKYFRTILSSYFLLSVAGFVMEKKSLGKRKVSDISEDNNWEITIRNLRM
jgi:hypothetical protein